MAENQGCVTNFEHNGEKLTIWRSGDRFRLEEFGVLGAILPLSSDPLFQSIAREMQRLALAAGKARRAAIEAAREREAFRKALEPFLRGFEDHLYAEASEVWVEICVPVPSEHHAAIIEACRLVGIPLKGEDNP